MAKTLVLADKTYENKVNTAPHPAGFCTVITPGSTDQALSPPSRWLMISDASAKAVACRLAGVHRAANVVTDASADISMTAGGILTSSTSSKFANLAIGDPVTLKGFVNDENNVTACVGATSDGTHLHLVVPGSMNPDFTGGLPIFTVAETSAAGVVTVTGVETDTQDTVTIPMLPGVMYPVCADQINHAATTATTVLCFR